MLLPCRHAVLYDRLGCHAFRFRGKGISPQMLISLCISFWNLQLVDAMQVRQSQNESDIERDIEPLLGSGRRRGRIEKELECQRPMDAGEKKKKKYEINGARENNIVLVLLILPKGGDVFRCLRGSFLTVGQARRTKRTGKTFLADRSFDADGYRHFVLYRLDRLMVGEWNKRSNNRRFMM